MTRRAQSSKKRTTQPPRSTAPHRRSSGVPTTADMQRPDHTICEDVELHLAFYAERDTRSVEVAVEEAEVSLTGQVGDDSHRVHAEQVAAVVPGTRRVRNRIAVEPRGRRRQAAPVPPEQPPMDEPGQRPNPAQ
jgi:osmotically-inducible protein OsmY